MKGLVEKLNDFIGQITIDTAQVSVCCVCFWMLVRMLFSHAGMHEKGE